jgi:hypothetical protein
MKASSSRSGSQFICGICKDGFEQKSRLERHIATAHPQSAPSAADVEKVLTGIRYPKTKEDVVQFTSRKGSIISRDLFELMKSLPERTYRDSAEIAISLGELKSGRKARPTHGVEKSEQPSKRGGRRALVSSSISAAAIAKVLSGIDFPESKDGLKKHAKDYITKIGVKNKEPLLNLLDQLPAKKYYNMADVEREIGRIK